MLREHLPKVVIYQAQANGHNEMCGGLAKSTSKLDMIIIVNLSRILASTSDFSSTLTTIIYSIKEIDACSNGNKKWEPHADEEKVLYCSRQSFFYFE